jgi:hypothetical protein
MVTSLTAPQQGHSVSIEGMRCAVPMLAAMTKLQTPQT